MASMLKLLDELTSYVGSLGIGTVGQNIFSANLPDSPIKCVALTMTGGVDRGAPDIIRRPTVQVLVRDESYQAGMAKADVIWNGLDHKADVLQTIHIRSIPDHEVGPYYRDANRRYVFTLNFSLVMTPDN